MENSVEEAFRDGQFLLRSSFSQSQSQRFGMEPREIRCLWTQMSDAERFPYQADALERGHLSLCVFGGELDLTRDELHLCRLRMWEAGINPYPRPPPDSGSSGLPSPSPSSSPVSPEQTDPSSSNPSSSNIPARRLMCACQCAKCWAPQEEEPSFSPEQVGDDQFPEEVIYDTGDESPNPNFNDLP